MPKIRMSLKSTQKLRKGRCKWCGEEFKKRYPNQQYCSIEHSKYAELENTNKRVQRYRKQFQHMLHEEQRFGLGSNGLSEHRDKDFAKESRQIHNEMKRLGIK